MNRPSQICLNLTTLEDRLTPATVFGLANDFNQTLLTAQGRLISFDTADPGTILSSVPIQGLRVGVEELTAIDFRPGRTTLYGLSVIPPQGDTPIGMDVGRIYTIDQFTGMATPVGERFDFTTSLQNYGFDFDPRLDRIRITTSAGENLQIDPDNGTIVSRDNRLTYAAGDANFGQDPSITASAYTNSSPLATTTQLYNIDSERDVLVLQSPAIAGTLNTVGSLGFGINTVGFDIGNVVGKGQFLEGGFVSYVRDDAAFITIFPPPPMSNFASIDLATGQLTEIGTINVMGAVRDIAFPVGIAIGGRSNLVLPTLFAVGSDSGVDSRVRAYFPSLGGRQGDVILPRSPFNPVESERANFSPFPGFTGGTRVAVADVNQDGIDDIIAGTGPGMRTTVRAYSGRDNSVLFEINPFEESFTGGVFVAVGDVTGDGFAELVVTPDVGGGPRVRVYNTASFSPAANTVGPQVLADFFGIEDEAFRGGARAAVGDVNNDGIGDLVVAAGTGGGPRIAVYDGAMMTQTGTPTKLFNDFFVFEDTLRNGVYPAVGDINGDGFAEVIAGAGPSGGPRVYALDGKSLMTSTQLPVADFFAGNPDDRGGVRVAMKDLDGDNRADIVTGLGNSSTVTAYSGFDPTMELLSFDPIPNSSGVFVG